MTATTNATCTETASLNSIANQENVALNICLDDEDGETTSLQHTQRTCSMSGNTKSKMNPSVGSMIGHSRHHQTTNKKKQRKIHTVAPKNTQNNTKISQIEIYDIIHDDDLEFKSQYSAEKSMHTTRMEKDVLFNDDILQKAKRPYYVLIFIIVLFIAVFAMNFIQILHPFLFNGLTPSTLCIVTCLPLILSFRYFEKSLIFQHNIIYRQIKEIYSLNKKLQSQMDATLQQKKYIHDLKLAIKEQEIEIAKLNTQNKLQIYPHINTQPLNLLHGFRKGQMEIQIEFAEITELIKMFNIVVSCIALLPFGMTNYRTKLKRILEEKIEKHKYLEMHFYFFMFSYLDCIDVKRLFRKHKTMKKVRKLNDFYSHQNDEESDCVSISSTPVTCTSFGPRNGIALEDVIYFNNKDPIKLFRSPIDHMAKVGFTVLVHPKLANRFCDPINGNRGIQKLKVRFVFNSNARPYLIDCYVKNDAHSTKKQKAKSNKSSLKLSSSFILKKGDDLRKDQAVLQMMDFMNNIWKENEMKYGEHFVACLIYKVIPIGVDCGIIEIVSDCIELNKIMTLKATVFHDISHAKEKKIIVNKFHRLIASSAASFIASFVCGIRDRHDDNILINTKQLILFHIDYGYIFNDKVSLDTAKFAITSDLKKIFEVYSYGWNDFVELCVNSWMVLRQQASELIDFARVVFAFLYESNEIEVFLRDSLKLEMKTEDAKKYIKHKIQTAPNKWNTKMKNLVHGFAQKMK